MALPKLTKPEVQIMEALWSREPCSIREIHESLPATKRLTYTTVQTMVYRLEVKKAVRRIKKIATAFIFEAAASREATQRRLVDERSACSEAEAGPLWLTSSNPVLSHWRMYPKPRELS